MRHTEPIKIARACGSLHPDFNGIKLIEILGKKKSNLKSSVTARPAQIYIKKTRKLQLQFYYKRVLSIEHAEKETL